jgi:cellulose biosynthesis protein BcsQ
MSKVVAFVNMKGGVGKTTASLAMAEASGAQQKRTLFVDLDLQINASVTVVGNYGQDFLPWKRHSTIEDVLENIWQKRYAEIPTFISQFGLIYLLSGSPSITLFERRLLAASESFYAARNIADHWMGYILDQARKTYDLIICDTPPGLSLLAEAVIRKADLIVIPQAPDRLSTQGIQLYAHYLSLDLQVTDIMNRTVVFINKRGHNGVAAEYEQLIRNEAGHPRFPYKVFPTVFGDSVAFKRAMDRVDINPNTADLDRLWGPVTNEVKAATRELWQFLGWIDSDDQPSDLQPHTHVDRQGLFT